MTSFTEPACSEIIAHEAQAAARNPCRGWNGYSILARCGPGENGMKLAPSDRLARTRRRTVIDIALRRQRPGTGSLRRTGEEKPSMHWPDLRQVLSSVPWAVTGAVAARLYMPERTTRDLDVLVVAGDAERVASLFSQAGFTNAGRLAIGGSTWLTPDGTTINVIEGEDAWVAAAVDEAQRNRDPQGLPILPLPYLVLMKLSASRVQDLADVSRMLGAADEAPLDATRAIVRSHAPELAEDLESLIRLGQLEWGEAGGQR